MNNLHIDHLLSEFIDGSLDFPQSEKVKSHITFCNACRKKMDDYRRQISLLKKLSPLNVPKGLEEKLISKLKNTPIEETPILEKGSSDKHPFIWPTWISLRNISVAAVAVIIFIVIKEFPDRPVTSEQSTSHQNLENLQKGNGASAPIAAKLDVEKKEEPPVIVAKQNEGKKEISNSSTPIPIENQKKPTTKSPSIDQITPVAALTTKRIDVVTGPITSFEKDKKLTELSKLPEKISDGKAAEAAKLGGTSELKSTGLSATALTDKKSKDAVSPKPSINTNKNELNGTQSGISALETVISNQNDWNELWKKHTQKNPSPNSLANVDFNKEEIVVISLGERPSAGYSVEITKIEPTVWNGKEARIVYYVERKPSPTKLTASVITNPFIFRVVSKIRGKTFFRKIP